MKHPDFTLLDQSHNLEGKIEATGHTMVTTQESWLRGTLADRQQLAPCAAHAISSELPPREEAASPP